MGEEFEMARRNETADRVQAAMNHIGGEDNLDMLMKGRARLIFELVPWFTEPKWFSLPSSKVDMEVFKDKSKFELSPEFSNLLLSVSQPLSPLTVKAVRFGYKDLLKNVLTVEIFNEDQQTGVFQDPVELLGYLGYILGTLPHGPGLLVGNAHDNIFFTKYQNRIWTLHARWNSSNSKWVIFLSGNKFPGMFNKNSRQFLKATKSG
jgi:hypothetical protein